MIKRHNTALKADVEIQMPEDGREDEVAFFIKSRDGLALTGNAIIEAVLLAWENCPMGERNDLEFDA